MGDVTIETLVPFFWTMVYITFALTMVTELEIVPATTFEIGEGYDLYFISVDGKHVLRSDLTGKGAEIISTLEMDGSPEHLCACPRIILENKKRNHRDSQRVCWECGFDLFVLLAIEDRYEKVLLLENFTSRPAVFLLNGEYNEWCDGYHKLESYAFRSFGDEEEWKYEIEINDFYQEGISGGKLLHELRLETGNSRYEKGSDFNYTVTTPFAIWPVSNATHIAGDYGVFQLGKDQICLLDPEKKRIALVARGFGPVVAKPPIDNAEALPAAPEEAPPNTVSPSDSSAQQI